MMKPDEIIKKLPIEIQEMFSTSFVTQEHWTPEWNEWAKNTLEKCNEARDQGFISSIQWQHIRNKYFGKLGGFIGEMPHCQNLDFLDFLYYDYPEMEKQ